MADGGCILRSTNGVQWTGQQKPPNNFTGVAYGGNGVFVAVQAGGRVFRSTDFGQTWQESLNAGQPWTTQDLTGVAFGNGKFVVTGKGSLILTSTDAGVSWSVVDLKQPLMSMFYYPDYPNVWKPANPATDLTGVAYGHGHFVATGANGVVFVSNDSLDWVWTGTEWVLGLSWSWTFVDPAGTSLPLQGVAYGSDPNQEYFVAVGQNGVTLIGSIEPIAGVISWTRASCPTTSLRGVAFGMARFVAVGYGATIFQSKLLPW